jgi:DNA-binding XRE family transcriptional regulator
MNPTELKVARMRRKMVGQNAADALGLTVDGYFKKEHGNAQIFLSDAFTLTKLFKLSFCEFVTIFFDGELPFCQDSDRDYNFGETAFPLKEARQRAGYTASAVASYLGMTEKSYLQREKGGVRITLEQCYKLSKLFGLSLSEFNDVFFRSQLPFGKEDLISYTLSIPQKVGEINAKKSDESIQ